MTTTTQATKTQQVIGQHHQVIMNTYGRYPLALAKGQGTKVWDVDGKEYLDFLGGIAVDTLGHCHPAVVKAITEQATTIIHTSNLYYHEPGVKLAQLLVQQGIGDQIFFCNSGAEANEGAIKLARKYHYRKGDTQRYKILSCTHSFHGRTYGALAATQKPAIQEGFGPMPEGFAYIEWNDIDALKAALDETVAAVIIEPVQGEGGIVPAPVEYLQAVRELTQAAGALMICDEIQCGMGRTGTFFAFQHAGIRPDIVTMAKGVAGGLPLGCIGAVAEVAQAFQPGDHGTTFGANPVVCAAAVATLQTMQAENVAQNAADMGAYLAQRLQELAQRYPQAIGEVRGKGLMLGMILNIPAAQVLEECHSRGLLANITAGNVFRLLPPLNITQQDVNAAVGIIEAAVLAVQG